MENTTETKAHPARMTFFLEAPHYRAACECGWSCESNDRQEVGVATVTHQKV